jgi:hypothetical protein
LIDIDRATTCGRPARWATRRSICRLVCPVVDQPDIERCERNRDWSDLVDELIDVCANGVRAFGDLSAAGKPSAIGRIDVRDLGSVAGSNPRMSWALPLSIVARTLGGSNPMAHALPRGRLRARLGPASGDRAPMKREPRILPGVIRDL